MLESVNPTLHTMPYGVLTDARSRYYLTAAMGPRKDSVLTLLQPADNYRFLAASGAGNYSKYPSKP